MYDNDDDIDLVHIGEALRGMQDGDHIGASRKALTALKGALGQLASAQQARRFLGAHDLAGNAALNRGQGSKKRLSTQIGISCSGTFTLSSWSGSTLPQVSGLTRVYKAFQPNKAILTELVTVTFSNPSVGTATRVASIKSADDLVLVQAFAGADNCFPNAPTEANGISGPTFANDSYGNGIEWPAIDGGIDMTVAFAIEQSVLFQVNPPSGYTVDDITSCSVKIRFNLLGPQLR